jgi:ribosomal protein S14
MTPKAKRGGKVKAGRKLKPKLIRDMDPKTVVFTDCNVCGRELIYSDEERMGMCRMCADE